MGVFLWPVAWQDEGLLNRAEPIHHEKTRPDLHGMQTPNLLCEAGHAPPQSQMPASGTSPPHQIVVEQTVQIID